VSDGALRALYERAVGLAFPSSYEGFGLPPVEAMASGCPVVVSTAGALPEVCGDAALYCETGDATTLAGHLARLASDDALRAEMVARGRRRAAEFTWRRHAERVVETLDAITAGDVARAAAA
jgi:glycosyltransferase involved in cell wall biosynthesis